MVVADRVRFLSSLVLKGHPTSLSVSSREDGSLRLRCVVQPHEHDLPRAQRQSINLVLRTCAVAMENMIVVDRGHRFSSGVRKAVFLARPRMARQGNAALATSGSDDGATPDGGSSRGPQFDGSAPPRNPRGASASAAGSGAMDEPWMGGYDPWSKRPRHHDIAGGMYAQGVEAVESTSAVASDISPSATSSDSAVGLDIADWYHGEVESIRACAKPTIDWAALTTAFSRLAKANDDLNNIAPSCSTPVHPEVLPYDSEDCGPPRDDLQSMILRDRIRVASAAFAVMRELDDISEEVWISHGLLLPCDWTSRWFRRFDAFETAFFTSVDPVDRDLHDVLNLFPGRQWTEEIDESRVYFRRLRSANVRSCCGHVESPT